jgi:hypothetical protein
LIIDEIRAVNEHADELVLGRQVGVNHLDHHRDREAGGALALAEVDRRHAAGAEPLGDLVVVQPVAARE